MKYMKYLYLLAQIIPLILMEQATLDAGEPVAVKGFQTYLNGKHIEIDLSIKQL